MYVNTYLVSPNRLNRDKQVLNEERKLEKVREWKRGNVQLKEIKECALREKAIR